MTLFRFLFGCLTLVIAGASQALGQVYPSKPIRIVVPVAAGGANDLIARILAEVITEQSGQPVIVENRSGAGGNIGMNSVARSEPDGYTLLLATTGQIAVNPLMFKQMPLDPMTDLVPVAPVALARMLLAVSAKMPVKTIGEFLALAKSQPGKINYASTGPGSTVHLATDQFARRAGLDLVHVVYRGVGPALTDVAAGHVQAISVSIAPIAGLVQSGQIRVLAAATTERLPYLPDVPTAAEAGVPGWDMTTWFGLFAPRGTPQPIIDQLNGYTRNLGNHALARKRFAENYFEIMSMTQDGFSKLVRADATKWGHILSEAGVQPE